MRTEPFSFFVERRYDASTIWILPAFSYVVTVGSDALQRFDVCAPTGDSSPTNALIEEAGFSRKVLHRCPASCTTSETALASDPALFEELAKAER